jgi:hypothetical protein
MVITVKLLWLMRYQLKVKRIRFGMNAIAIKLDILKIEKRF